MRFLKDKKFIRLALIGLVILIFAALPRLLQLNAFLMVDENLWYQRSANFLQGLTNGNLSQTVQTGHPGVTTMWSGSVGLILYYLQYGLPGESWSEFANRMAATPVTLAILQWLRLPLAFLSAASVVLVFWLSRRLFNWQVALISAGLLAFEPFFLAHSRVLHHDAATAIFSLLALLSWLLYLKEGFRWSLLITGIMIALAILSKISSVFLLGFIGLTLLPRLWQQDTSFKQRLSTVGLPWLQVAGFSLLTAILVWPALWSSPLTTINTILKFIGHESGAHANGSFFMGQFVLDPGLLFYPVSITFNLSPLTLVGVILAIVGLVASWLRANQRGETSGYWQWIGWLFTYVILFVVFMSFVGKKQQRYILPAIVTLNVIAGWGWFVLLLWGKNTFRILKHQAADSLLITILIGGQLFIAIPYAPYYSTYFNPLLGGATVAQETLLVGRGEGLEQAVAFVLANSQKQNPQISTWYGTTVTTLAQDQAHVKDIMHPNFILESDYVFFYINQLQREKPDQATLDYVQKQLPLINTIQLAGIDYVTIYRGKAVSHPIDMFAEANRLAGRAYLAGIDLKETLSAGDRVPLQLFWINDGMQPGDHFYVRLTDDLEQDWGWGSCHADPAFGDATTWQDDQIIESQCQLEVYAGTPPGTYLFRAGVVSGNGTVIGQVNLSPDEGTMLVTYPPDFPENEWIVVQERTETAINKELFLIGYDYTVETRQPGDTIPLTFYWRSLLPEIQDYKVRLSLLSNSEKIWQWEDIPVNGRHPTVEWLPNEVVRDLWQVTLPPSLPNDTYDFVVTLLNQAGEESGLFKLPPLTIKGREREFSLSHPPAHSQQTQLGENIAFLGYNLSGALDGEILLPGQTLNVDLTWQAQNPPLQNYTVFVQLLNETNQVYAQHDSQPALPTITWATGEYIQDTHYLALPPDLPAGEYQLIVGMYIPETGERLSIFEQEQFVGDHVPLEQILRVSP